ncbi:MAG: LPS export ABC transporter permease LptF [Gallionellales bacterium 35-53-114]|jgi:lipopolysaccharide export system permease protein|nr:MAG: LPS export ABC transporter permease LptF [Gallionellales bacterium 35-53-114]OYZ64118.1 MAG: LPS export ABC transporter permease LptF [Gallionellales bacterium 24-53-125]OZB10569.1 MAG: LPS export ABC transporter permease LptF [Gallionellales bacterium 39-52-133]HQS57198.1 LPS export ABC transporter permease LptF [Gallionellaceae bacterium]HQS74614.1 LPS export ABC transporter permease LptF [Gallionellaceae bacterium]
MSNYPQTHLEKSKPKQARPLRTGVFDRSLVREFATTGFFVFAILLAIIVLTQLIRLLGESVGGTLPVEAVLVLLGFSALNYLPILLSISLFLSVLLTLTRSYSDSEMVVWFSAGMSLKRWMRPVVWYALPVVSIIALLSLVLAPWAMSKVDEIRLKLESRDDVAVAAPGTFRESRQADRVFFLENAVSGSSHVGNIFVQSVQQGKVGTMVAREGLQETAPNGDKFIVLLNGTRHEGTPGQLDYKVVEFERYAMRVETVESKNKPPNPKAYTTLFLLENQTSWNLSEFNWRVGLPISAVILALLAIPFSFVNPRAGRSLNLIGALVLYMVYNNLLSVINTWVGQGKVAPVFGLLGLHVVMIGVMVLMFYYRVSVFSFNRLRR